MENIQNFNLIEGTFEPKEAWNILCTIISNKISFNHMESLSIKERYGKESPHLDERVKVLEAARKRIRTMMDKATEENKKVEIKGHFMIGLTD